MNADEVARKEEERLLKSMSRNRGNYQAQRLQQQKIAEQKKKERAAREEEERREAEERKKKIQEEYQKKREAELQREKELEEKRAAEAAEAAAAAASVEQSAGLDPKRAAWEEERMLKRTGVQSGAPAVQVTAGDDDDDGSSAAEIAREKARMEKMFGPLAPSPVVAKRTVQKTDDEQQFLANAKEQAKKEQDRMAASLGVRVNLESPAASPQRPTTDANDAVIAKNISVSKPNFSKNIEHFEEELLAEINKVRTKPQEVAASLEALRSCYDGKVFNVQGSNVSRGTKEGVSALNDAISFLKSASAVGALALHADFSMSCDDLVKDNGVKGLIGRDLSDGTLAGVRLVKYGRWQKKVAEMLNYGDCTPEDIVNQWVIDDGMEDRSNRLRLMDPEWTVIGIAHGYHAKYERMCSVALAVGFEAGAAPAVQAATPQVDTTQSTAVLQEKETADGKAYEINTSKLDFTKENLKLLLKNRRLLHLMGIAAGGEVSRNWEWELPLDFSKSDVSASFDSSSHVLHIRLAKAECQGSVSNEERLIQHFELEANSAGDEKFGLDIAETNTTFVFTAVPSKHTESVDIKIKEGTKLAFEATHKDDDGYAVTSIRTVNLPLSPVLLADQSTFTFSSTANNKHSLTVLKTASANIKEVVEIPIA